MSWSGLALGQHPGILGGVGKKDGERFQLFPATLYWEISQVKRGKFTTA